MTNKKNYKLPPLSKNGPIFLCSKQDFENCKIGLLGVPYDGTTSFRPGARFGPSAAREVSNSIESFCPQFNMDLEDINFVDLGSIDIPFGAPEPIIDYVNQAALVLTEKKIKTLLIGGEHTITIGAVNAISSIYSDLILVQLDAHADLRKNWLGSKFNHACTMNCCLDVLPSKQLFQVGIRSGTREEFKEMKSNKRLITNQNGCISKALEAQLNPFIGKPIYLTVDLDWFDPSVMPGTGTPEPGGFFWNDFEKIINILKKHNIIAADIVELSPHIDPTGISSILAAKAIRSLLMLLNV